MFAWMAQKLWRRLDSHPITYSRQHPCALLIVNVIACFSLLSNITYSKRMKRRWSSRFSHERTLTCYRI